jgi:hypothetical protein
MRKAGHETRTEKMKNRPKDKRLVGKPHWKRYNYEQNGFLNQQDKKG